MFFSSKDPYDTEIQILEGYLNISDAINQMEHVKKELDDFEKKYAQSSTLDEYLQRGGTFETYDLMVSLKRAKLLEKIINENFALKDYPYYLKSYLKSNEKYKYIFDKAEMVMGYFDDRLLPSEIIDNDQKCRRRLTNVKNIQLFSNMSKKR